jgi:ATP-dependent DNA helicase RecG
MCSVEFKVAHSTFTVIFRKVAPSFIDALDNQILKLIHVPMKSGDLQARLGVSKNTILRRIEKLGKLGLVEKKGSGAHIHYVIKQK